MVCFICSSEQGWIRAHSLLLHVQTVSNIFIINSIKKVFLHRFICMAGTDHIFIGNQRWYKIVWNATFSIQISWTFYEYCNNFSHTTMCLPPRPIQFWEVLEELKMYCVPNHFHMMEMEYSLSFFFFCWFQVFI